MLQKPYVWNATPALVEPRARELWKSLAFLAPLWCGTGKGALLGPHGGPLAGANLTAGSTLGWRGTPYGMGAGISGASNLLTQSSFEPITTSDGAGTGDFTLLVLANPISEARLSSAAGQGTASNPYARLAFNSDGLNGLTAGQFGFVTRTTAATGVTVAGAIDGNYHLFAGRRIGTVMDAFVDGVKRNSNSGAIRDFAIGTCSFSIGNDAGSATSNRIDTGCNIVLAAGWNRALSDAEMRMLARDPFCMLRPSPEWRGVWTPVGGASTLSPADLTDGFGFETPVFSQVHNLTAPGMRFAESMDAAGFSQAHLFSAGELNSAFWFDAATLGTGMSNAPDFRSRSPVKDGRSREVSGISRVAPMGGDGRTRLITE